MAPGSMGGGKGVRLGWLPPDMTPSRAMDSKTGVGSILTGLGNGNAEGKDAKGDVKSVGLRKKRPEDKLKTGMLSCWAVQVA